MKILGITDNYAQLEQDSFRFLYALRLNRIVMADFTKEVNGRVHIDKDLYRGTATTYMKKWGVATFNHIIEDQKFFESLKLIRTFRSKC